MDGRQTGFTTAAAENVEKKSQKRQCPRPTVEYGKCQNERGKERQASGV
jgi:hypothetical protein